MNSHKYILIKLIIWDIKSFEHHIEHVLHMVGLVNLVQHQIKGAAQTNIFAYMQIKSCQLISFGSNTNPWLLLNIFIFCSLHFHNNVKLNYVSRFVFKYFSIKLNCFKFLFKSGWGIFFSSGEIWWRSLQNAKFLTSLNILCAPRIFYILYFYISIFLNF